MFSNPDVVRRANAEFIPVALKAATVNGPPDTEEGRLYRELGRSRPAPQGICVANSAGKVLAWALMFDNDASVLGFLDYTLKRFESHPGAEIAVAAERFMRYPSEKMQDVADNGQRPAVSKHREGERCLGAVGVPEGTLSGRAWGRAFKEGKALADTTRQESYIEDRFEIPVDVQEFLARAIASAGEGPIELPDGLSRALVATAHLGMLDVNPLDPPGGRNDRKEWSFRGRKDAGRIRFEGTSWVAGGESPKGQATDGRRWSHEVKLSWRGSIEMKGNRITRLLAVAEGHEKLKWGNERMKGEGRSEVAMLPAGCPIDFEGEARYGFEGEPAAVHEIGSGLGAGPPGDVPDLLRSKIQRLQGAIRLHQERQEEIEREIQKVPPLVQNGDFPEAEKQIDRILELLKKQ